MYIVKLSLHQFIIHTCEITPYGIYVVVRTVYVTHIQSEVQECKQKILWIAQLGGLARLKKINTETIAYSNHHLYKM